MPLGREYPAIEDITFNEEIENLSEIKDAIIDVINWETEGDLLREGRNRYMLLQKYGFPPLKYRGIPSGCLKIKGTGHVVKTGNRLEARPPSSDIYLGPQISGKQVVTAHMTIDDYGKIVPVVGGSRFTGALKASNARNEYDITNEAMDNEASVCLPVAFGKYSQRLVDEEIGIVVLGERDGLGRRVRDLTLAKVGQDKGRTQVKFPDYLFERMTAKAGHQAIGSVESYFECLFFDMGKCLRLFHDGGFLRHAGHLDNYQIDEGTGELVILDLDTSIRKASLPKGKQFLSQAFDVMSSMRGIHEAICMSALCFLYVRQEEPNLYYHFLTGYLNNLHTNGYRKQMRDAAGLLWKECTKEYIGKEHESYRISRNAFTPIAVLAIYDLMQATLENEGIEPPYGQSRLRKELNEFMARLSKLPSA
ncbi:MAG: hypothetical protein HYX24_05270 [Candidatus Aenigmarchaeota archaeon]|nr:hypothetical protein [Candidatus Aenigmarchaeota archaeon]